MKKRERERERERKKEREREKDRKRERERERERESGRERARDPLRGAGCRFPDFRSYIEGILLMCLLKPPHHKNECSVTTEG